MDISTQKKSKPQTLRYVGIVFFVIELVAILLLTFTFIRFPILPTKYIALYGTVCVSVLGITGIMLLGKKGKKRKIAGIAIAVITAVGFFAGFFYLDKTRTTLNNISGATQEQIEINQMAVMVLNSDPARVVADTLDYSYGVQNAVEYTKTLAMVEFLKDKYKKDLNIQAFNSYSELASGLLDGTVRAIIVDTTFVELMEEYEEGFAEATRIVEEFDFTANVPSITITPTPVPTLAPGETPTPTPEEQPEDPIFQKLDMPKRDSKTQIDKNYFTVYFSGIDTYGEINKRSRSDVNIVMTVNPKTKKILLVTIPRDAYVTIPGVSGGSYDKLTHAGLYGVKTSMNTLQNVYGVAIDYYVRVNFSSVEKFVDIVGGINVNSPANFSTGSGYKFTKGNNFLNGKQALAFARERHAFAAGDIQRGKNQMEVIKGVINKMASPAMLTNFSDIMNAISGNFQTDLSMDQLTSLVRMQLNDGAKWSIDTYAVVTKGGMNYCYSYRGSKLYVGYIDKNSAITAGNKMREVMEGK